MATYSATLSLSNGTLTISRPHPAPGPFDDLVDELLYRLRDAASNTGLRGIGLSASYDEDTGTATVSSDQQVITEAAMPQSPVPDGTDTGSPSTVSGPLPG